jgi:copper chaperone CopZ
LNRAQLLHAIDGRLRIRVGRIKNNPYQAEALCEAFRSIAGVKSASANLITGSITITYDGEVVSRAALCGELARIVGAQLVPLPRSDSRSSSTILGGAGHHVARAILNTAMEAALKRTIYSLI